MLFHQGCVGDREGEGLFSFFTSCFGSHSFVDQGWSVCLLWAQHEDSAGSVGESVEQNMKVPSAGGETKKDSFSVRETYP